MNAVLRCSLLAALLACTAIGCTSPDAEPARPTGTTLPPRSTMAPADRITPCSMLTSAQLAEARLRRPTPGEGTVDGQRSPACTWLGAAEINVNVQFIPIGADAALSEPGSRVIRVNGFGAVENIPGDPFGGTPLCQVTVDTGDGQSLRVQALTSPRTPAPDLPEQCRQAEHVASLAMTTVVATATR